jgi:hypothetical protein
VGRNPDKKTTDLLEIDAPIANAFWDIAKETRQELTIEIEPWDISRGQCGCLGFYDTG